MLIIKSSVEYTNLRTQQTFCQLLQKHNNSLALRSGDILNNDRIESWSYC